MGMQKQSRIRSKSQLAKILVGLMVTGSILAIPSKSAAQEVIVKVPPPAVRVETIPPQSLLRNGLLVRLEVLR